LERRSRRQDRSEQYGDKTGGANAVDSVDSIQIVPRVS